MLTEELKGPKIKMCKNLLGIKYVSPVYIEECVNEKEKLPF